MEPDSAINRRPHAATFIRWQIERLGAQQTNPAIQARRGRSSAGLRQGTGEADRPRQFLGQRAHQRRLDRMGCHGASPPIKAQRDYRTLYRVRVSLSRSDLTARSVRWRRLRTMDPKTIGLFDLAERRLAWADQRQTVLAQNIANVNTPGYKPHDLRSFATTLDDANHRGAGSHRSPIIWQAPPRRHRPTRLSIARARNHPMATPSRWMSSS